MSTSSAAISSVLLCKKQRGNYYTLFVYFHIACRFFFIHLILRVRNSILRQLTIFRCFLFFLRFFFFNFRKKTIGEACEVSLHTVINASEIIASETIQHLLLANLNISSTPQCDYICFSVSSSTVDFKSLAWCFCTI